MEDFYTISELCDLFNMSKSELRQKCKQYDIKPRKNDIGDSGFVQYDARRLHNKIYHEGKPSSEEDLWAD